MFKFVSSFIGSIIGKKRALDVDEEDSDNDKRQKVHHEKPSAQQEMIHRVKVSNLPDRDLPVVKKYLKDLGYNRFKKAPNWSFGFITVDVNI